MGPADSPRISRVLGYSGVHWASVGFRVLGCHRLWLRFPSYSANLFLAVSWILLPHSCRNTSGLGCSAFARHYWRNHCYFLFLRVLRCFSSPRWLTAWRYDHCWPGCPIRIFTGLGLFAPYRNFSQLITSFFASESLGIHLSPLFTSCVSPSFDGSGIHTCSSRFLSQYVNVLVLVKSSWRITDSNR